MPSQGFSLGVPPPPSFVDVSEEDLISVSRIVVTRPGTVTDIGGWISGDPAGSNPDQPGRFVLYADTGANAPGAFLTRTQEGTITGGLPQNVCIKLPVEGVPIHVTPGTYWVGIFVGNAPGTGEWRVLGDVNISGKAYKHSQTYPTQPNPYPLAGATITTGNSAALGFVFLQDVASISGTVVGTFVCGTKLVGQDAFMINTSTLLLNGRRTTAVVTSDFKQAQIRGKPSLILRGKTFDAHIAQGFLLGRPQLILRGKSFLAYIPQSAKMQKPTLILNGEPTSLVASSTLFPGIPTLYLLGRQTVGKIPGLTPSIPTEGLLTPSVNGSILLEPALPETGLLVPTVPVIA